MAKPDKLFVTDAECAERIGVTRDEFKRMIVGLSDERPGFL